MTQRTTRRRWLRQAPAAIATPLLLTGEPALSATGRAVSGAGLQGCQLLPGAEFYVSIDNKGLWPNLTKLPSGELAAAVYNHPSHGYGSNSDVELWVSDDGGRSWSLRSQITDHPEEPNAIRMNQRRRTEMRTGDLIALVSGYHEGAEAAGTTHTAVRLEGQWADVATRLARLERSPRTETIVPPAGRPTRLPNIQTRQSAAEVGPRSGGVLSVTTAGKTWGNERKITDASETFLLRRKGWRVARGRANQLRRSHGRRLAAREPARCYCGRMTKGESLVRAEEAHTTGSGKTHISWICPTGRLLCSITKPHPGSLRHRVADEQRRRRHVGGILSYCFRRPPTTGTRPTQVIRRVFNLDDGLDRHGLLLRDRRSPNGPPMDCRGISDTTWAWPVGICQCGRTARRLLVFATVGGRIAAVGGRSSYRPNW